VLSTNKKTVLIDYDIIVYRCGFASESRKYLVGDQTFDFKSEAKAISEDISVLVYPEPLENALHSAKHLCQTILDRLSPVESYRGYLTGKGNFRNDIATIKPYKGNRKNASKPFWFDEIKQYLIDHWNAEETSGIEADDKLCIEFNKNPKNSIIVSIDKDFNQIPYVNLFNFVKNELIHVPPLAACKNFYTQMLTGDTVDNIQGCKKIGPKTAAKLLDPCKDTNQCIAVCQEQYKKSYADDWKKAWDEHFQLLKLLDKELEQ